MDGPLRAPCNSWMLQSDSQGGTWHSTMPAGSSGHASVPGKALGPMPILRLVGRGRQRVTVLPSCREGAGLTGHPRLVATTGIPVPATAKRAWQAHGPRRSNIQPHPQALPSHALDVRWMVAIVQLPAGTGSSMLGPRRFQTLRFRNARRTPSSHVTLACRLRPDGFRYARQSCDFSRIRSARADRPSAATPRKPET